MVFLVVLLVLLLLLLVGLLFNSLATRLVGSNAATALDLAAFWLLVRLIIRCMVFPGSVLLVQRNTEATYRVEMARQYAQHLKQLHAFLGYAAKVSTIAPRNLAYDGPLRGFAVVECLSRSFRMQQGDEVRLSEEQAQMFAVAQGVERWLLAARVRRRRSGDSESGGSSFPRPSGDVSDLGCGIRLGAHHTSEVTPAGSAAPAASTGSRGSPSSPVPLIGWLRDLAVGAVPMGTSPLAMLMGVEIVDESCNAAHHVMEVQQLLEQLNELRSQKSGWWESTMRFMRVPTIGSLNQLRTELQMRYPSQQCWVRTKGGRRLDAMFLTCQGGQGIVEEDIENENIPLSKPVAFGGPTIVWCNPNAGYYETMVYQTCWLNFYLDRGCNVFLFNYSGFGRSTSLPSTSRLAQDGDAVVAYLKGKGITEIGVHGRSIGGVAACHLARRHPDVVKFMIADRTFSTLGRVAQYSYGGWAAKGLKFGLTKAETTKNFLEAKCYKVLMADPKDSMIVDLAALRTAVALEAVAKMAPQERLACDDARLRRLKAACGFFQVLFASCEGDDDAGSQAERGGFHHKQLPSSDRPSARQTGIGCPYSQGIGSSSASTDVRLKSCGESPEPAATSLAARLNGGSGGSAEPVGARWLEDHAALVRSAMGPFVDQIRSALDVALERLDAGGLTLNEVLGEVPSDPCLALRATLANLQVWGSIGDQRSEGCYDHDQHRAAVSFSASISDHEIEAFLRKSDTVHDVSARRIARLEELITPGMVSDYHRRLARSQVAVVRRELRRRLGALEQALRNMGDTAPHIGTNEQAEQLRAAVLDHLSEVEGFVSAIGRFFKSVDLMPARASEGGGTTTSVSSRTSGDSSDERLDFTGGSLFDSCSPRPPETPATTPWPTIDHATFGYLIHIDCGHNGVLDESEFRHLGLHLRAARFGRLHGDCAH